MNSQPGSVPGTGNRTRDPSVGADALTRAHRLGERSSYYTALRVDMGICSFLNFWNKNSASVTSQVSFQNLKFCVQIKVNTKQQW